MLAKLYYRMRLQNRIRRARSRRHDPRFMEKEIFLLEFLLKGGTAIDVGANKGLYASLLAELADRVICFEPNPRLAAKLRHSLPDNCEIRTAAISDRSGPVTLHFPLSDDGRKASANTATLQPTERSVEVEVMAERLDDLDVNDVRLVKIDVEGHEEQVLDGAVALIREHRPILLIEVLNPTSEAAQKRFAALKALNYSAMRLDGGILQPLTDMPVDTKSRNFLFLPN